VLQLDLAFRIYDRYAIGRSLAELGSCYRSFMWVYPRRSATTPINTSTTNNTGARL